MSYIDIDKLTYFYPNTDEAAIKNIKLGVEHGEILLICGSSGCGKSTLAKCIASTVPNFYGGSIKGLIKIEGIELEKIDRDKRANEITMVFQDPEKQLIMNKVHREVAYGLENIGVEEKVIKRRVWEALQFCNILDLAYRDIKTLSGGQKQKVSICSALAFLPKCIILDEPTSELDPDSAEELVEIIRKINEELDITVIIIEQRIDRWLDICDKIVLMKDGNIVFNGEKKEFYKNHDEYFSNFIPIYLKCVRQLNRDCSINTFKDGRKEIKRLYDMKKIIKRNNEGYSENLNLDKNTIIEMKKLNVKFDNITALYNINIDINEGDFIGIMGPNGSGKSTLLKSIMGLIKYEGSIKINKTMEVKKNKVKDLSKIIGYVSQNPNDYISKDTVYEELKFTLDNFGITNMSLIDETLKELNIYNLKDINPRDLSGGEKQRVAIASIIILKPKILLLDEPTRGLDYITRYSLGNLLKKLNSNGTTILIVTHDIDFAASVCNKFMLMFEGNILSNGKHKEVFENGIFYTTTINKLFRGIENQVFTLNDFRNTLKVLDEKE